MNAEDLTEAAVELVSQSMTQAPIQNTLVAASMWTGAMTGSNLVQGVALIASVGVVINTIYSIKLSRLRIKNETKENE